MACPANDPTTNCVHDWRENYYGFTCSICGAFDPSVEYDPDDLDDDWDYDEPDEPTGSCECCGQDVYDGEELCDGCEYGASDDVGGSGIMIV